MRRPLLVVLLAVGTVWGFSSGFHQLHHRGWGPCMQEAPAPSAPK